MVQQGRGGWRRKVNRYVALVSAVVGVAIVLSSFLFLQDLVWWYLTVAIGLVIALFGFVYGVYPFLTSEREYSALRQEADGFIKLVRQLNRAATSGSSEDFERMAELAGKED